LNTKEHLSIGVVYRTCVSQKTLISWEKPSVTQRTLYRESIYLVSDLKLARKKQRSCWLLEPREITISIVTDQRRGTAQAAYALSSVTLGSAQDKAAPTRLVGTSNCYVWLRDMDDTERQLA
jgi:hypothetical protein